MGAYYSECEALDVLILMCIFYKDLRGVWYSVEQSVCFRPAAACWHPFHFSFDCIIECICMLEARSYVCGSRDIAGNGPFFRTHQAVMIFFCREPLFVRRMVVESAEEMLMFGCWCYICCGVGVALFRWIFCPLKKIRHGNWECTHWTWNFILSTRRAVEIWYDYQISSAIPTLHLIEDMPMSWCPRCWWWWRTRPGLPLQSVEECCPRALLYPASY